MSETVGPKIAGIMCLTFAVPMIAVMMILEALGLGEFVTPIMMPIIIGITVTFIMIGVVFAFASRTATRRGIQFDRAAQLEYEAQMFGAGDYIRTYQPGATFTIPVYCPHCQSSLRLDKVHWSGPQTLVCQECFSAVELTISEDF
ncbi:MAG: hypothetical protein ACFFH0_11420 [Promethearchaeota archaeon]